MALAPIRKVYGGGVSGAAATVVLWVLDSLAGVPIPALVAAAITLLVTSGVSYLIPSPPGESGPPVHVEPLPTPHDFP